ncbi:MAG: hypothetical protein K2N23_02175, partial [Clostridia bacterium]|nr:hypothetical protein [Clostridia bacterium]
YSYNCASNQYVAYASGKKRFDVNANVKGRVDKTADVIYYECLLDSSSVFEDGVNDDFMSGKYYFSGEDTYMSFANADGNFGDWSKEHVSELFKSTSDILTYLTGDIIPVGDENKSLSDFYDKFTFDEKECNYSAVINYSEELEWNVKISFKDGKIYHLDWVTKNCIPQNHMAASDDDDTSGDDDISDDDEGKEIPVISVYSYSIDFFDYNATSVQLPEELKNL